MLEINITSTDIRKFVCDIVVLKYARQFYGADLAVATALSPQATLLTDSRFTPKPGEHVLAAGGGLVAAKQVLFVGVVPLREFEYAEIRNFTKLSLRLTRELNAEHVAMTVHRIGGLDERESFLAQLGGIADSFSSLTSIKQISFVEWDKQRATRLRRLLEEVWPWVTNRTGGLDAPLLHAASKITAGVESKSKPHVFVAMPFREDLIDIFDLGIRETIHSAGLLCERMDMLTFTGDILERMKSRIETAALVIADLTGANANVYLEIGYAWGKGRPTLLLSKVGENVPFDVQSHRRIVYKNIGDLRRQLGHDLSALRLE